MNAHAIQDKAAFAAAAAAPVADSFVQLYSRFHWISLVSALLLGAGCWYYQRRHDPALARSGLLRYLFPRKLWLHRSALLDYRFVIVDKLLLGAVIGLGALLLVPGGDEAVLAAGGYLVHEIVKEVAEDVDRLPGLMLAYTAALLVTEDFLRYWAHRLMHASRLLWQFHKVHHSTEVLVPFSQMRTHPVNGLVNLIRSGLAIGIVTGSFMLIFPGDLNAITILGINAGRFLFDAMGSHLRHSHVWLSWGSVLSRIFISPAQHQIHHSRFRRHWDHNFGSQFALWDWMFGTLYIPRRRERLVFGLGPAESSRLRTVRSLYFQPFKDASRLLRAKHRTARHAGLDQPRLWSSPRRHPISPP